MSRLSTVEWWRDLAALTVRQVLQVILPILTAVQASAAAGERVDLVAVVWSLIGAVAVTVFFAVARAIRDSGDPSPLGMILRAGAGVLAGLGITDLGGFAAVDWGAVAVATVGAMLIAAVHLRVDPPVLTQQRLALAA